MAGQDRRSTCSYRSYCGMAGSSAWKARRRPMMMTPGEDSCWFLNREYLEAIVAAGTSKFSVPMDDEVIVSEDWTESAFGKRQHAMHCGAVKTWYCLVPGMLILFWPDVRWLNEKKNHSPPSPASPATARDQQGRDRSASDLSSCFMSFTNPTPRDRLPASTDSHTLTCVIVLSAYWWQKLSE